MPSSRSQSGGAVTWISIGVLVPICILSVLPIWILIISSVASTESLASFGFQIFPSEFSWEAYRKIFAQPDFILRSYSVSIAVTVAGTLAGVAASALFAYVISRQNFGGSNFLSFFLFFTLLFNGGTLSSYLLISNFLHWKNNLLSLIVPLLISPFNVLLLRSYFRTIPLSLIESARIDGASEFRTFRSIVLPLSMPAVLTVGLFTMLMYWNDMTQALLYIDQQYLYPLQYLLYKLTFNQSIIPQSGEQYTGTIASPLALRMGMATIALIPIFFSFLAVQKHFVRGIMLGGIKGD